MDEYKLKNGENVILREVEKHDAKAIINFYNEVGGETDYLSFGKDEFLVTVDFEEKYIENIKSETNSTLILAIFDEKIVGAASINSSQKRRLKHVGTLGIVIKKEFCKMGLGSVLINYLVNWSKSNGITKKITLITRSDNHLAIGLYKKIGFEIEGMLKDENYENGVYYDCLTMGLIL